MSTVTEECSIIHGLNIASLVDYLVVIPVKCMAICFVSYTSFEDSFAINAARRIF